MNGPLQGRTKVLDLDETRANEYPADYDTDLEFPWADQSKIDLYVFRRELKRV